MFGQTGCVSLGPKADNSALIIVLIIIAVVIVLGLCSAGAAFRNPTASLKKVLVGSVIKEIIPPS